MGSSNSCQIITRIYIIHFTEIIQLLPSNKYFINNLLLQVRTVHICNLIFSIIHNEIDIYKIHENNILMEISLPALC